VATRCAGELGRLDLRDACIALLDDDDPSVRMQAARSAVLLGERARAVDLCAEIACSPDPARVNALPLALLAADRKRARALLERLGRQRDEKTPATIRFALYGVALAGDLHFIDWLIALMNDPLYARLAGEAFAMITGADLALLDLERKPPAQAADDETLTAEHGMPWPDPEAVAAWWHANKPGFTAGARHFVGAPPDAEHCRHILRESRQHRRRVAALHLALAAPGSVLFNIAAPAWRQQRLLKA
jgi:uncharacterized protein (TIGR02270 family)